MHYSQELLTTFGMMHALNCDAAQLDAELRGRSVFPDPHLLSVPPPPLHELSYDSTYDIYQFHSGRTNDPSTEESYRSFSAWHRGYHFEPDSLHRRVTIQHYSFSLSVSPSYVPEESLNCSSVHCATYEKISTHASFCNATYHFDL